MTIKTCSIWDKTFSRIKNFAKLACHQRKEQVRDKRAVVVTCSCFNRHYQIRTNCPTLSQATKNIKHIQKQNAILTNLHSLNKNEEKEYHRMISDIYMNNIYEWFSIKVRMKSGGEVLLKLCAINWLYFNNKKHNF